MKNSIKFEIPTTRVIGDISDWDMTKEVTIREGDTIEHFRVLGIDGNKLMLARINEEEDIK